MNNNKYNVYKKRRKSASNEAASFKIAHLIYMFIWHHPITSNNNSRQYYFFFSSFNNPLWFHSLLFFPRFIIFFSLFFGLFLISLDIDRSDIVFCTLYSLKLHLRRLRYERNDCFFLLLLFFPSAPDNNWQCQSIFMQLFIKDFFFFFWNWKSQCTSKYHNYRKCNRSLSFRRLPIFFSFFISTILSFFHSLSFFLHLCSFFIIIIIIPRLISFFIFHFFFFCLLWIYFDWIIITFLSNLDFFSIQFMFLFYIENIDFPTKRYNDALWTIYRYISCSSILLYNSINETFFQYLLLSLTISFSFFLSFYRLFENIAKYRNNGL